MATVVQRTRSVKQPRGGYLPVKEFEQHILGDGIEALNPNENVSPTIIGIVVDYLTRFASGAEPVEAFQFSEKGANILGLKGKFKFKKLIRKLSRDLNDDCIIAATKLCGFDSVYRAGMNAYVPIDTISPDEYTIANIRTMVQRSLRFLEQYGPKIADGLTFEGGYTKTITAGDGDFMTRDTLWDMKVSKNKPDSKQTLQLGVYWRMGIHSRHPEYNMMKYLGIYNPRMNTVYRLDIAKISDDTICAIDRDVIGY